MSLRRIYVLYIKEIIQGPKNFLFLFALITPVVLTLLVTLVFGTYLSGKSRLGVVDPGGSRLTELATHNQALSVRTYQSISEMEDAVGRGALDMGLVLPAEFDRQLAANETTRISVYVWGESQVRNRVILGSAIVNLIRQISGQNVPVEIEQVILGNATNIPWQQRLLPLIVMMAMLLSGVMIPATSLVGEKTKRTLTALNATPATMLDVFAAKGLLGVTLSVAAGILTLFLNQAFGDRPLLLLAVLALGSVFSAAIGVMLGALAKDISSLFATIKGLGILLYAPAFVYMFPEIPQWIGRVFPTYYIIQPVLEITQNNAGLADIGQESSILVGLIVAAFFIVSRLAQRTEEAVAAA
jgi:ABC-2 type transport system permease protein